MLKPPYFKITAYCDNVRCTAKTFFVDRKRIIKKSTSGQDYTITTVVCPVCRRWAAIRSIKEVRPAEAR